VRLFHFSNAPDEGTQEAIKEAMLAFGVPFSGELDVRRIAGIVPASKVRLPIVEVRHYALISGVRRGDRIALLDEQPFSCWLARAMKKITRRPVYLITIESGGVSEISSF
jgi:hypothetical protein